MEKTTTSPAPTKIDVSRVPARDKPAVKRFFDLQNRVLLLREAVRAAGRQDLRAIRRAEAPLDDAVRALADLRARAVGETARVMDLIDRAVAGVRS